MLWFNGKYHVMLHTNMLWKDITLSISFRFSQVYANPNEAPIIGVAGYLSTVCIVYLIERWRTQRVRWRTQRIHRQGDWRSVQPVLCRSDLQSCQVDADMGRRIHQENSCYTFCRRDQDFHRPWYMVFVFVCMCILFTIYFLGYLSTVCFVQVRTQ